MHNYYKCLFLYYNNTSMFTSQDELKQLIVRNKMVKQPLHIEMDESLPMTPIHSRENWSKK